MKLITNILSEYLKHNKRLVVPKLGAFIVKQPSGVIRFTELIRNDDGILRSLLMEILNIVVHSLKIESSEPKHRQQILDEFISRVNSTPRCREVAYFAQLRDIAPKPLSAIVADGTGFTAKEYIERAAIATIKQLLSTTSLTVKEIAERLDYSGSGNLCRFFKTNTGITISEFKQSLKR